MATVQNTKTFEELEQAVHRLKQRRQRRELVQKVIHPVASCVFFLLAVLFLCGSGILGESVKMPFLARMWESCLALIGLPPELTWKHLILILLLYGIPMVCAGIAALVVVCCYKGSDAVVHKEPSVEAVEELEKECKNAGCSIDFEEGIFVLDILLSVAAAVMSVVTLLLWDTEEVGKFHWLVVVCAVVVGGGLIFAIHWMLIAPLSLPVCLYYHKGANTAALEKQLSACRGELKAKEARIREQEKAEEQRRETEELLRRRQEGDELYRQASAAEPVDEQLMERAADLGSVPACLYVGRALVYKQEDEPYTEKERRGILETAMDYLSVFDSLFEEADGHAALEETANVEGEFLYLFAKTLHDEDNSSYVWQKMLDRVRELKASGKLPEKYDQPCNDLIGKLVDEVDFARSTARAANTVVLGSEDYARIAARADEIYHSRLGGGTSSGSQSDAGAYGYPSDLGPSYRP